MPEIQFTYAVLDFKDLHISKKVSKLIKQNNYIFKINENFPKVLKEIQDYHKDSWIEKNYEIMLLQLYKNKYEKFKLYSFELYCKETENLVAAEIGYKIGHTYTSLTGFFQREKKYSNYGTLQLVLLSQYLEREGYHFWNLGHACLQYKIDLGAKVLNRTDFLRKWKKSI